MLRTLKHCRFPYRPYHTRVIDHYENPRNVGSFDKKDKNVGTGLVGAPACIHEDTLIAVADGRRNVSVQNLYIENKIIPVWSYNSKNNIYEIKNARIIKNNFKKKMKKIIFDDDSFIICTGDHKFLLKNNNYVEVENINNNESIVPFKRRTTKKGYWEIRKSKYRNEYVEIYKFHNPNTNLNGHNIHHIDFSKTNDSINNLQYLTIKEHIIIHPPRKWTIPNEIISDITKDMISNAISHTNCRCETADMLEITHRELYELLEYYEIENKCKRKMTEDIISDISDRMKTNNPYSKFSAEQKLKFATHVGEENGRFIKISNDELLKIGKKLIETNKKLTCKVWMDFAKSHPNKIPQGADCIKKRFNINTWNEFVEKCNDYNHKIKRIEDLEGEFDCYDLQVEENNNFAVITKETKNIQNGIIIKNCGDVLKLQIKVDDNGIIIDTKFKTFGCGSAIASSSIATEWIKGKTLAEAINVTNTDIAAHLKLPPVKLHCSMLAEDAIKSAVRDLENKKL
jgi:NifU-like protein involved in Fe-S cluster formation